MVKRARLCLQVLERFSESGMRIMKDITGLIIVKVIGCYTYLPTTWLAEDKLQISGINAEQETTSCNHYKHQKYSDDKQNIITFLSLK